MESSWRESRLQFIGAAALRHLAGRHPGSQKAIHGSGCQRLSDPSGDDQSMNHPWWLGPPYGHRLNKTPVPGWRLKTIDQAPREAPSRAAMPGQAQNHSEYDWFESWRSYPSPSFSRVREFRVPEHGWFPQHLNFMAAPYILEILLCISSTLSWAAAFKPCDAIDHCYNVSIYIFGKT